MRPLDAHTVRDERNPRLQASRPSVALLACTVLAFAGVLALGACGKKQGDSKSAPNPTPVTATNPDDMEGGGGRPGAAGPGTTPPDTATPMPATNPDDPLNPPTIKNTKNSQRVRVWFGTNRAMVDPANPSKGFGTSREPDPALLHVGSVVCDVPNARPVGSTGSSWITRLMTGEDDRITVAQLMVNDHEVFFEQIAQRLAQAPQRERAVLVYIHGYKNSFNSAALRAAQLAVDLRVPGLTAFYSWPSKDSLGEYNADEAAVETAERHLEYFLRRLANDTGASQVHIIAHSMGNRVLARVMQRLAAESGPNPVKFGQIILAAPDIDTQVFFDLARAYPRLSQRTTLYVSRKDMALEASGWSHSFPRAGYAPPVAVLRPIDTVEVTSIDVGILGHGYVAEAQRVLDDVAGLLRRDAPPSDRANLVPATTPEGLQFWHLQDADR